MAFGLFSEVLFCTKYMRHLDYMCRWEIFSKINKHTGLNTRAAGHIKQLLIVVSALKTVSAKNWYN